MTRRAANVVWCLAFVLVALLAVALGGRLSERKADLDLWCEGESAHQVLSAQRPAWLATRFRLDLRSSELSHIRMAARLIDADSGVEIAKMHRNSAFLVQQHGHRLQLDVVNSAKGESDSTNPELLTTLGMFIFRTGSSLSYWMSPVSDERYLFEDGNGMFILCSKR